MIKPIQHVNSLGLSKAVFHRGGRYMALVWDLGLRVKKCQYFIFLASNKMNNFNLLTDLANNASAANFETDQKSNWSGFKNTWNDESSRRWFFDHEIENSKRLTQWNNPLLLICYKREQFATKSTLFLCNKRELKYYCDS